jgi:hypothetical protein
VLAHLETQGLSQYARRAEIDGRITRSEFEVTCRAAGGLPVYFRDIIERKAAEHAARARSEQLEKLADIASLVTVISAEARVLIGVNQAVTSLTNAEADANSDCHLDHRLVERMSSESVSLILALAKFKNSAT